MTARPANIHRLAYVAPTVQLADDVEIGAFAYIEGCVSVGAGTRVYPGARIGCDAEHASAASIGWVRIGAGCRIRENVTVQRGTGDHDTTIGDGSWLMAGSHIGHDCVLGADVRLAPGVKLGGHTWLGSGANLGLNAVTHPRTTVGAFCMLGMGSVVTKDVPPFYLVAGNPARFLRYNTKALDALGLGDGWAFSEEYLTALAKWESERRAGRGRVT